MGEFLDAPPPEFSISAVDLVDSPPPAQQTAEGQDKTQRVQEIWNDLGLSKSTALKTPEQRQKMWDVLYKYESVFTSKTRRVGGTNWVKFSIDLMPGATPKAEKWRRVSPELLESQRKQIEEWIADGVIAPSSSPWACALHPVSKKDSSVRWTVDYRPINKQTIPDKYPVPLINDILATLGGSKYFSSLDAAQAITTSLWRRKIRKKRHLSPSLVCISFSACHSG